MGKKIHFSDIKSMENGLLKNWVYLKYSNLQKENKLIVIVQFELC